MALVSEIVLDCYVVNHMSSLKKVIIIMRYLYYEMMSDNHNLKVGNIQITMFNANCAVQIPTASLPHLK